MSLEYEELTMQYGCVTCGAEWYGYKEACPVCSKEKSDPIIIKGEKDI